MRTKSWEESIKISATFDGDVRLVTVEPGDMTRYCVMLARVGEVPARAIGETPGWFVRLTNFGGNGRAMYVRDRQFLRFEDIRDGLGVSAEGSAQFMCELLAYLTESTRCESWDVFQSRLDMIAERRKREREQRAALVDVDDDDEAEKTDATDED